MKVDREKIYNKFGGKCAYCGIKLNGKFQLDHIIPKANYKNKKYRNNEFPEFLKHLGENDVDHIDNLFPACQSCNVYKHSYDLEFFRRNISRLIFQLNEHSAQFRMAKRYGLVNETGIEVEFYFEKAVKDE